MKKHEKGFTVVEALLLVVILGVLVGVGWYVYSQQNSAATDEKTFGTSPTLSDAPETKPEEMQVIEANIGDIIFKEDLSKLPEVTPDKFIEYMEALLPSKNSFDASQCQTNYSVTKISQINIRGGQHSVKVNNSGIIDEDSGDCVGGAYQTWGINNEENWAEAVGGHAFPFCKELENPKIYSEFVEICLTGDPDNLTESPNPNGSIFEAGAVH